MKNVAEVAFIISHAFENWGLQITGQVLDKRGPWTAHCGESLLKRSEKIALLLQYFTGQFNAEGCRNKGIDRPEVTNDRLLT